LRKHTLFNRSIHPMNSNKCCHTYTSLPLCIILYQKTITSALFLLVQVTSHITTYINSTPHLNMIQYTYEIYPCSHRLYSPYPCFTCCTIWHCTNYPGTTQTTTKRISKQKRTQKTAGWNIQRNSNGAYNNMARQKV